MNWQDYPHLFANGKFKLKYKTDKPQVFNNEGLRIAQNPKFINDCQLIARKIEDMTDEELSNCEHLWHDMVYYSDEYGSLSAREAIEIDCEAGVFDTIMHLLSIGIFPFMWPEDGSVIDAKEVV